MSDPYKDMGISEEDLTEEEKKDATPDQVGMESFGISDRYENYHEVRGNRESMCIPFFQKENEINEEAAQMCHMGGMRKEPPLLIRTQDGKNFRVYMHANMWFTQPYLNKLCRFLDSRHKGETVTFVLGTKMTDWQAHIVGALASSMMACQAEVTTIVAGYCGITETILWCFGHKRLVYRYGALTFGQTEIVKSVKEYQNYFHVFFAKCKEIGVLTEQEVKELTEKTGKTMMLLSNEIEQRLSQQQ